MRHFITHLVVAFCSSAAISASPLSPNPSLSPHSPGALSPMKFPDDNARALSDEGSETFVPQKRSIGGYAYHKNANYGLYSRDTAQTTKQSENELSNPQAQSDPETDSEPDYKIASDLDFDDDDNDYDDSSDIDERSLDSIMARSDTPSTSVTAEHSDKPLGATSDKEEAFAASDDIYSSNSEDDDDLFSAAWDEDDMSSLASDDEDSITDNTPQSSQAASAPNSSIGDEKKEKVKRGIEIGGELDSDGGRTYISKTRWIA